MGRIPDYQRRAVVESHLEHGAQAEQVAGSPIIIDPATTPPFGIPELEALLNAYDAVTDEILLIDETDLPLAYSQRDGLFGTDAEDYGGVRFRLLQYKQQVKVTLGGRHPLVKTVPNLGKVRVNRYLVILDRFIDHWQRVNELSAQPMVIGDLTLDGLTQRHADLEAKMREITGLEGKLQYLREERERIFGDVPEEERELTSIVARLLQYHNLIETTFPGQPIADSLPEIFPSGGGPTLPTCAYGYQESEPGVVLFWVQVPVDLTGVQLVYAREGIVEYTRDISAVPPGQTVQSTWTDVTIVDGIDEITLRDAEGRDIARGVYDPELPNPGP